MDGELLLVFFVLLYRTVTFYCMDNLLKKGKIKLLTLKSFPKTVQDMQKQIFIFSYCTGTYLYHRNILEAYGVKSDKLKSNQLIQIENILI